MIVVHHLNNSRSQRVLWLLEELELPYEIKFYERDKATMLAPPELKAVHPLGKSPVITDGAHTIAESGAIIDYIISTYGNGRLIPAEGTPERLRYNFWLHYAEGSAMPPLLMKLIFGVLPERAPFFLKPIVKGIANAANKGFIDPQLKLHTGYWERRIGQERLVRGRHAHRRGHPDELSGRSRRQPGRCERGGVSEPVELPHRHPRPTRLQARARKGRPLCLR